MIGQRFLHFLISTAIAAAVVYGIVRISYELDPEKNPDSLMSASRMFEGKRALPEATTFAGSYLASRHASIQGDLDVASLFSGKAYEKDSKNRLMAEETLRLHVAAGKMDEAIVLANRMEKQDQLNTLANVVLMVDAVARNDFDGANVRLNMPDSEWLDGILYRMLKPLFARWIAYGAKTPDEPVLMDDSLRQHQFIEALSYYHLALINDLANHNEKALELFKTAKDRPDSLPYRLVQALSNFYLRQGQPELAIEMFAEYETDHPGSKLVPEVIPHQDEAPENVPPLIPDARAGMAELFFTTGSILFGQDALRDTMIFLRFALYLQPDLPPAQLMLANLLEYSDSYPAAIQVYQSIREDTVFYKRGQIRTALNYELLDQKDKAIRLLERLTTIYPKEREVYVVLGDIYRTNKDHHRAIQSYSNAVKLLGEYPQPKDWRLFYARGTCYERAGRWEEAEKDLSLSLELNPGEADILNYLGYSWLVSGTNIEKAREYIELALQAEPFEAHIIDSMGWVHYQMGEFKEAVEFLEQAAGLVPEDATINDHLGDAYWRVGREIEARFQWERALKGEPEDEEAIKKKLSEGLPPFEPILLPEKQEEEADEESAKADEAENETE
ncbi:MAG: tetratricopeptide repeat protein [Rickettsiales bacterium]|nr:tetratricopeptide repeat protein [Rickettsiales bacterium]